MAFSKHKMQPSKPFGIEGYILCFLFGLSDYFSGTVLSKPPLKMMVISSSDITLMQSMI